MVRRLLFGALAVAAILILTSAIYVLEKPPAPQPSVSAQMALTSDDLGLGWTGVTSPEPYDFDASETQLTNATFEAFVWLVVFDNITECECWFQNGTVPLIQPNMTVLSITLGDEASLCYYGPSDEPRVHLMFAKDNIGCNIITGNIMLDSYKEKPWWINTATWIASLQLQKINQYLAQHPGAS